MKYDKTKEKNYDYWNNIFDDHDGYMLESTMGLHIVWGWNEYGILRKMILAFVEDGETLFEVGCASGNTYEVIKKQGRKIFYKGTDYAENFIKANKERMPDGEWEVQDARYLKEKDDSWDVVLIYDVIDNMEGQNKAIDEAIRVANKRVILLMWMDNEIEEKKDYLMKKGLHVLDIDIRGCIHFHKMLVGFIR